MIISEIDPSNYSRTITEFYLQDRTFLTKYHSEKDVSDGACVKSCMGQLRDYDENDIAMHEVHVDGNKIGFFTLLQDRHLNAMCLYQFFILPMFRTSANRNEMMGKVKELCGKVKLMASVYSQNEPVMRFYRKVGNLIHETKVKNLDVSVFELKAGESLWR